MELILLFSKLVPQDSSKFLMSFATVGEISVGPGGPLNMARFYQALYKDSEKYRFVRQFSQKRGPVEFDGFTVNSTVLPWNRR